MHKFPLLLIAACALALTACGDSGGSGNASASSDSDRDTAQLKLQECLRKNGVDVPRRESSGSDSGPSTSVRRVTAAQEQKMRKAMEGPCKSLREKAFGNISAEDRQEQRDRMVKFTSCMRKHGVDLPEPPGPGQQNAPRRFSMRQSPKLDKATEACRKLLPRGGRGRPGGDGPGGGPDIQIGPPPGGSE